MRHAAVRLLVLVCLFVRGITWTHAQGITDAGWPMVDPSLDDPTKPWCYFIHPTTCIGVPFMPQAVQVTPEGNIFTNSAEFCLFTGKDLQPMGSRQRRFLEGYIPVVSDSWTGSDGLYYSWEAFGFTLDGFKEDNTLQFIKLTVTNKSGKRTEAKVAAAVRHSAHPGGPLREHAEEFRESTYEIKNNQLFRDGKIVCAYPPAASWEAVPGTPYSAPFAGKSLGVTGRTEVGLAHYAKSLRPGESMQLLFKMPRVAVGPAEAKYLAAMQRADYKSYRKKTIDFWKKALTGYSLIHTPGEPSIEKSHRAAAVHTLLATRTLSFGRTQTDGLPYTDLFLSAIYDYGQLYTNFNLKDFVTTNFSHALDRQQPSGLFVDIAVSHGAMIHCAHGQTTSYISDFIVNTRNEEQGRKMFPAIQKAVELIRTEHQTQPHGLMSAAPAYDNEMISGQWTSHNYWTIIGLRAAIRLATFLDEQKLAANWLALYNEYEQTVLKAVRESAAPDGYVPTGLYDFIADERARRVYKDTTFFKGKGYAFDQDWENEMLLWPTELVQPGDPLVAGTLKRLRETKYREGIMTYRNGMHLHQYITTRAINQYIASGQPKEALKGMYSALLHSGSATESFENMIRPWTDRDVEICPPPHGWGCANLSNTIRNLFVMEQGGRGGLEPEKRDLLLLNAVSPAWLVNGKPLGIENAPTSFGVVTVLMTPRKGGADVTLRHEFHTRPHQLVIRLPYFVTLKSFKTDAREYTRDGDVIRLSPNANKLSLEYEMNPDADMRTYQEQLLEYRREVGFWPGKRHEMPKAPEGFLTQTEEQHPGEPLSFNLILNAWRAEYKRRFDEHVRSGGKVKSYAPVPIQPAAEREVAVKSQPEPVNP
jgi:hypothetical protein